MKLMILGAGKYGREIEDVANQMGRFGQIDFLDDFSTWERVVGKCGDFPKFQSEDTVFFVAFGDNEMRSNWLRRLFDAGAPVINIIHPTAYISPTAALGRGVAILPKALVNSYCVIGDGCMINSGAIVDHDTTIGDFAHVFVGAIVRADNRVPPMTKIAPGALVERNTYQ